ncbi:hypothetical protein ACA910_011447 [Epithemia clementina (nom. ined.)]
MTTATNTTLKAISAVSSPTVAVIGFGPAGMFFCHHVEERRRKLLERRQEDLENETSVAAVDRELARLPRVTCFEQASGPGGIWRADRVSKESLWTNGPKEVMEFFDYTFADHYGRATKLPSYLPRAAVLDYMMARVTRNAPDFCSRYVQFQTQVVKVSYASESRQFTIQTKHVPTGRELTQRFDKCIWAAGVCGLAKKPESLLTALQKFTRGPIVHSSEPIDWDHQVTGRHILLIGGSYSAEDLALTALKRGVDRVTIVVRDPDHNTPVLWSNLWPDDKVEILTNVVPMSVDEETQTIQCCQSSSNSSSSSSSSSVATAAADEESNNKNNERPENSQSTRIAVEIENVDTIFLCTGYGWRYDMMDGSQYNWQPEDDAQYEQDNIIVLPEDWKMKHDVLLDNKVPNPKSVCVSDMIGLYSYHRCVYILNPNYMMMDASAYDAHLLSIDILAHLLLSVILGETKLPSRKRLVQDHREWILNGLHLPHFRWWMDPAYRAAMQRQQQQQQQQQWQDGAKDSLADLAIRMYEYSFAKLAQAAKDGNYPVDFGSIRHGLTKAGQAVVNMDMNCRNYRQNEQGNATFRDLLTCGSAGGDDNVGRRRLQSIYTGNVAVPFHSPWMELDDTANPVDLAEQEA